MEPRFGHDFSRVRVHTDAQAADSARAVNALAYTVGPSIVFGADQYRPHRSDGRQLLAHELVHAIQQGGAATNPPRLLIGDPDTAREREAERLSDERVRHEGARLPSRPGAERTLLQRTCRSNPNRSFYETAPNYCRDSPGTGQLHPGQTCFREVPKRSGYLDCPPGDQVCFDEQGHCFDSWDEASPVESKDADGTCNLHFACSLSHAWKDKVIQTWLDQEMAEIGRRHMDCVKSCEELPWYSRGFCLQGCSGGMP